jgi:hypothetical protein
MGLVSDITFNTLGRDEKCAQNVNIGNLKEGFFFRK